MIHKLLDDQRRSTTEGRRWGKTVRDVPNFIVYELGIATVAELFQLVKLVVMRCRLDRPERKTLEYRSLLIAKCHSNFSHPNGGLARHETNCAALIRPRTREQRGNTLRKLAR